MAIKVEGILNPFGKPIARAVIVVTTLGKSLSLKNTYIRKLTESDGWYSFNLEKGIYLVEYKQNNVLTEVGKVYVTEETPQVITLEELVRTQPAIDVPKPKTENIDWESELATHEALAAFDKDINQATKEGSHSIDYEEASFSTVGNKGRSVDEVSSSNGEILKESVSFSKEGNNYLQDKVELLSGDNTKSNVTELSSTTTDKYTDTTNLVIGRFNKTGVEEVTSTLTELRSRKTKVDSLEKLSKEESSQRVSSAVKTESEETTKILYTDSEITVENRDSLVFKNSYLDVETGNKINQPVIGSYSYRNMSHATGAGEFSTEESSRVNPDGNIEHTVSKSLIVYGKEALSTFINNGLLSVKEYLVDVFKVGNTFEVDTRTNVVKVNGKLEVENKDDFKGDLVTQVFQYSSNGIDGWQDDFDVGLKWRRHNTSVNGVVNPLTWSKAYLLVAEDGHDGDTLYFEYQYSYDKLSWSNTLRDGDIWRRERIIENGIPISSWTTPARIRGVDGESGDTIFIEYQYSINGVTNWHSNFSTGDHYRRERTVVNGVAGIWSTPAKIVPEKGEDYFDGLDGDEGLHGNGSYIVRLDSPSQAASNDIELDNNLASLAGRPSQAGDMITYELKNPTAADTTFPRRYIRGTRTISFTGFNAWEGFALVINGNAVIDGTLAASALKAKDITGDYISASARIIVGSGNQQSGMNGLDTDQWTGWRFWSGHSNPNLAPYRVDRTGKAWLENVNVKGHVEATSGSFTGSLYASNGTLNNVVIENNCVIKGELAVTQLTGDITSSDSFRFPKKTSSIIAYTNYPLLRINIPSPMPFPRTGRIDSNIRISDTTIANFNGETYIRNPAGILIDRFICLMNEDKYYQEGTSRIIIPQGTSFLIPAGVSGDFIIGFNIGFVRSGSGTSIVFTAAPLGANERYSYDVSVTLFRTGASIKGTAL